MVAACAILFADCDNGSTTPPAPSPALAPLDLLASESWWRRMPYARYVELESEDS